MNFYQIYAQIKNEEVLNTIVAANYTKASMITKAVYGSDAQAICCNDYKVSPGCKYIAGQFYESDRVTLCEENLTVGNCKEHMDEIHEQQKSELAYVAMEAGVELEQE